MNFALLLKEVLLAHSDDLNLTMVQNWNASNCSFPIYQIMELLENYDHTKISSTLENTSRNDLTNYANDIWLMIVTMTTGEDILLI